jgi:hypothetical protein
MAATTPRKRPTRVKVAPSPTVLIALDVEDADKDIFDASEPLFTLAGKTYEARTAFSASEALQYSRLARTQGLDAAVDYALASALGDAGFEALSTYKYLTKEAMQKIIGQIVSRFTGQSYNPK